MKSLKRNQIAETLRTDHKLFQDPEICRLPAGATETHTVELAHRQADWESRGSPKEMVNLLSRRKVKFK